LERKTGNRIGIWPYARGHLSYLGNSPLDGECFCRGRENWQQSNRCKNLGGEVLSGSIHLSDNASPRHELVFIERKFVIETLTKADHNQDCRVLRSKHDLFGHEASHISKALLKEKMRNWDCRDVWGV